MEKKKVLVTSLLSAGLIVGGALCGAKIYKDKKEKEDSINKLQNETELLTKKRNFYTGRRDFYFSCAVEDTKTNPDYDNMEKVFTLVDKLDLKMYKKYDRLEENFNRKCKKAVINTLGNKKSYYVSAFARNIEPYFIEDWMYIIDEHKKQIRNFDALNKEYQDLKSLENLMWDFDGFVYGDLSVYVDEVSKHREKNRKSPETGKFVENKVAKYNDCDNLKQNQLVQELFQQYLDVFMEYGKNNMPVVDKKLYQQICELTSGIVGHNNLEAGAISYNMAIDSLNRQISYNKNAIANLQHKNR